MHINIEIPDDEINQMVEKAIQERVNEWIKDSTGSHSSFRRLFDEQYKKAVKEMIYEPQLKQKIIDQAVKEAAIEIRKKGMSKLAGETGYWIVHPHERGTNWEYPAYECSKCHEWSDNDSDFCPHCGIKMEGQNTTAS